MSEHNPSYFERLRLIKLGQLPKEAVAKPRKAIPKVSEKKKKEVAEMKAAGTDGELDRWFSEMRKRMVGRCLFCGGKSFKHDDERFRWSIGHLLPKRPVNQGGFPSVGTCEENWIELCAMGEKSCHQQFDNGKITWLFLKDSAEWSIIKEKLLIVLPMVAQEERKHKLYDTLEKLVYDK